MSQQTNQKLNEFWSNVKTLSKKFWQKAKAYVRLAKPELIVLFSALLLDLITKFIISKTMSLGQVSTVIPNFFNLHYVLNTQAAFGQSFGLDKLIGISGVRIVFIFITTIALSGFAFFLYFLRGKSLFARISLALIIAGAMGNFYDRIFIGAVRDFAEIVFFGLNIEFLGGTTFAIFNIADAFLVYGAISFSIYFVFYYKSPKEMLVGPVYQPNYVKKDENSEV